MAENLLTGIFMQSLVELTIKQIKEDNSITSINLRYKKIGDVDIKGLCEVLKTNTGILNLDLSGNDITDLGIKDLCELLKVNSSILNLDLSGNKKITDSGIKDLSYILKTNTHLSNLGLRDNYQITDIGFTELSEALKINTSLSSLDLMCCKINNISAKALSKALKINRSLSYIRLHNCFIDDEGIKYLSKALKINIGLLTIDLGANLITNTGFKDLFGSIKVNASLLNLDLSCSDVDDTSSKDLSEALKINTKLLKLDLTQNKMKAIGAQNLSEALKINNILSELVLTWNPIGNSGANYLSEALKINTGLRILVLSENEIGIAGAILLFDVLEINTSLSELKYSYNQIGTKGCQKLSEALKINTTLTSLDLTCDKIKINDDGARALSEAIKINTGLSRLILWQNEIGSQGIKDLSEALIANYNIVALEGVSHEELTTSLKRNQSIVDCLKPMHEAINKHIPLNTLEIKYIEGALDTLDKLAPEHSLLPGDSYLSEAYRLLTAIGHMIQEDKESLIDAFNCLRFSFKNQSFQKSADEALGHLFSGDLLNSLQKTDLEQTVLLIILHSLRNHLNQPESRFFAYIALYKLIHPGKILSNVERQTFLENTVLLHEQDFFNLIKNALTVCQNNIKLNEEELLLLDALLAVPKDCFSFTANMACQSSEFVKVFKAQYPKANCFSFAEHCLVSATNKNSSFVIKLPQKPSVVTKKQVEDYSEQLIIQCAIGEKRPSELIDELKEKLYEILISSLAIDKISSSNGVGDFGFFKSEAQDQHNGHTTGCTM